MLNGEESPPCFINTAEFFTLVSVTVQIKNSSVCFVLVPKVKAVEPLPLAPSVPSWASQSSAIAVGPS